MRPLSQVRFAFDQFEEERKKTLQELAVQAQELKLGYE